jgi:hypothetical protein
VAHLSDNYFRRIWSLHTFLFHCSTCPYHSWPPFFPHMI